MLIIKYYFIFIILLVARSIQNIKLIDFSSNSIYFAVEIFDSRSVRVGEFVVQKS